MYSDEFIGIRDCKHFPALTWNAFVKFIKGEPMGYYIQGPAKGKGQFIIDTYGARSIDPADITIDDVANKAVICVIDNGPFEAAAFCYNDYELTVFATDNTGRPKQFYIIEDREQVKQLTGYE